MRILTSLTALVAAPYAKPVLALGNFDGVHRGHQTIFRQVVARARELGGTAMVFTFDPHPLQVLAPDQAPSLLTTATQKMRLIAALGLDVGLQIPFTEEFAGQQPLDFIREVLCRQIGAHDLLVGYDFRFGHRRAGTTALLQAQAATFGYRVTVIPAITHGGMVVSSSNIRRLLQEGQVEKAAHLLGRYYDLEGQVIVGFRRGAALGFPTANVRPANVLVPLPGVYVVRVEWEERVYPGVANVGYNPTFVNQTLSVEAHLFDFASDLYGATVRVAFIARLRDERKFASLDELRAQIERDVQRARAIHAQLPLLS